MKARANPAGLRLVSSWDFGRSRKREVYLRASQVSRSSLRTPPGRPQYARKILPLALALLAMTATAQVSTQQLASTGWTLVGWNNLGMHCMDSDYSVFSILPPFNTINAQLVDPSGLLVTNLNGITVTYQAIADPDGSINKSSIGKSTFWQYSLPLFGVALSNDMGLAGSAMPGAGNVPQPMPFDTNLSWFGATGIPITPYDDASNRNPYPMMHLVARDGAGSVLASTDIVLPVSDEMDCRSCHLSGSGPAAEPAGGWITNANPELDYRLNILRLHDDRNLTNAVYLASLATNSFNAGGLYATVVTNARPILCAGCHASAALGTSGFPGVAPLTRSVHSLHATVTDPTNGMTLEQADNRSACYRCHPGSTTRCLRGVMGSAVAADGSMAMQCQSCHGSMSVVGGPARSGWLSEPNCQSCHTGTATDNNGMIRYTSAFDSPGHYRVAVNQAFATNPDVPGPGFSLYRFSAGHGGIKCEGCHGSTHAEFPSSHRNDNIQSLQIQGHVGALTDCTTCHNATPSTVAGGPHGMHPVGQDWVNGHGDAVGSDNGGPGPAQCQACHGADYSGTVLSRAKGDRSFSTAFGTKFFWRGFQVSCYACHNGPGSENASANHPPAVVDTAAATPVDTPVVIALQASDADGNPLTLRVVSQPAHGTAGLAGTQATYYPEAGYAGADAFTFAAWDGFSDSNLGTVSVTVGGSGCAYTLSTHLQAVGAGASTSSVTVATSGGCSWTASTTDAWIQVLSGQSVSGSGTVVYAVAANGGASPRTGVLNIGGQTVTVQQAVASGSDLSGDWVSVQQTCKGSGSTQKCKLKGSVAVQNTGNAKLSGVTVSFFLSANATFDGSADTWLKDVRIGSINANKSKTVKLSMALPQGSSASGKYLIAIIDPDNLVPETNKANNIVVFGPVL